MVNNCFLIAAGRSGDAWEVLIMIVVLIWVCIALLRLFGPIIGLLFYSNDNSGARSGRGRMKYTKAEKELFFSQANLISPKAKEAVERLATFFLPNRRVTQGDVDSFLAEYAETKDSVDELYKCNYRNDDVLRSKGIQAFHEQVNSTYLGKQLKTNNTIFDSIQSLNPSVVGLVDMSLERYRSKSYYQQVLSL